MPFTRAVEQSRTVRGGEELAVEKKGGSSEVPAAVVAALCSGTGLPLQLQPSPKEDSLHPETLLRNVTPLWGTRSPLAASTN